MRRCVGLCLGDCEVLERCRIEVSQRHPSKLFGLGFYILVVFLFFNCY